MIWIASPAIPAISAAAEPAPVRASLQRTGATLHLRLIGEAPKSVVVRYSLTTRAGGNRAEQSGTAHLTARKPATLLDLTQSVADGWAGTLDVQVDDGRRYHIPLTLPADPAGSR